MTEWKETSTKIRLSDEAKKEIEFCLYNWMAEMHILGKKRGKIIDYSIYVNYEIDEVVENGDDAEPYGHRD